MSKQIELWKTEYYGGIYNERHYFRVVDYKFPKVMWEQGSWMLKDLLTPQEYLQLEKIEELIIKQYNLIKENDKENSK